MIPVPLGPHGNVPNSLSFIDRTKRDSWLSHETFRDMFGKHFLECAPLAYRCIEEYDSRKVFIGVKEGNAAVPARCAIVPIGKLRIEHPCKCNPGVWRHFRLQLMGLQDRGRKSSGIRKIGEACLFWMQLCLQI